MIKYGIWCKFNDANWTDDWACAGLAKYVEPKGEYKIDEYNQFYSEDINFTYLFC